MKILLTDTAKNELRIISDFIASDKPSAAFIFLDELTSRFELLKTNPLQCRKSRYCENPDVRDLIFRGYTIVYRVKADAIEILRIFNQNRPGEIRE